MPTTPFPRLLTVRQKFPASPPLDIPTTLSKEFAKAQLKIKPGARIAVAVGSRGITHLQTVVAAVLDQLKAAGAQPFIVPAMGSHGGATPEGQKEILAEYGITEQKLGVPICAAMDVENLGITNDGVEMFFSSEALQAEGIVVVNRIKPHTDFQSDSLGSGLLKMLVVGLGKRVGAANFHVSASHLGYERVLRSLGHALLHRVPILCGVALVENQSHQLARLAVLKADRLEAGEAELFVEAKRLMPKLPFDEMDLLIVDRIGKNISGSGMDPNIIGRGIHGYTTAFDEQRNCKPIIRRLFVRDVTPESHGNAIGIGMADFTTTRLVRAMDAPKTFINSLTSLSLNGAKVPIHFETDREILSAALTSLAMRDVRDARVVRIADTLSLERLQISESLEAVAREDANLEVTGPATDVQFDAADNLLAL